MAFDFGSGLSGATSGGALGSALGPIGTAVGAGLGGLAGGFFGSGGKNTETPTQAKQRELVDQLIGSLNGQGPFANLFSANEEDFNKGFRDPAMAKFKSQTIPDIQQGYVGGQFGQQRGGTGIEDSLARAGVDMEQLLNENYLKFQQGAQNRQSNAIGSILGQGAGAPVPESFASQYFGSEGFGNDIGTLLNSFKNKPEGTRQGFESDQI